MSRRPTFFNFRSVADVVGIPATNANHWALGKMLVELAQRHGVEPERILTAKTDPNPSVDEPHCIAHYPMTLFEEACKEARSAWENKSRQLTLFSAPTQTENRDEVNV